MKKSVWIALKNIKKKPMASISVIALILIATIFLCVGWDIFASIDTLYTDNKEKFGQSDNFILIPGQMYKEEYYTYLENDERIARLEEQECIHLDTVKIRLGEEELQNGGFFLNAEESKGFFRMNAVESEPVDAKGEIMLPVIFKQYGYKAGMDYEMEYKNETYSFPIAGFYETAQYGISNVGSFSYYLTDERYRELKDEIGTSRAIAFNCKNIEESREIETDFFEFVRKKADRLSDAEMDAMDYSVFSYAYTFMGVILSCLLLFFALIVVLLSTFIIRFRIRNSMEDSAVQIGIYNAIGYKGREIRWIFLFEYLILAAVGIVMGMNISQWLIPLAGKAIGAMVGLSWEPGVLYIQNLIFGVILVLFCILLSQLATRKLRKMTPVKALSKGREEHSKKREHFPLENAKGNLSLALAKKSWFSTIRSQIIIMVCLAGITFTLLFGIYMYITFGVDMATVKKIGGMECPAIEITLNKNADVEAMREKILSYEGVKKVLMSNSMAQVTIEGTKVYVNPYEDFSKLEDINAYEGRLPECDNELLITKNLADSFGKRIGDSIRVEMNGYSFEYVISGFNQALGNGGKMIEMTSMGYQKINPYAWMNVMNVYLEDEDRADKMIERIQEDFGKSGNSYAEGEISKLSREERIKRKANEKIARLMQNYGVDSVDYAFVMDGKIYKGSTRQFSIASITNCADQLEAQIKSVGMAFEIVTLILMLTSMIIITLMLAIIIHAMISKRKLQFGIQKAMGYTSRQLTMQLVAELLPAIVAGCAAGLGLTAAFVEKVGTLCMKSMGISKMEIIISPAVPAVTCLGIGLFTVGIALWHIRAVKKISVYQLMTD